MRNVIPEGMRDFTTDECIKRKKLIGNITEVFCKWGYKEILTPTLEYYETFNHKTQSLKEQDLFKFFDNTGRILVLRPDMTVPVARMVSTKLKDINPPIKIFYTANVFRVHESLAGRRNEYLDCGIELLGVDKKYSDLEVLVTAIETLKSIGNDDFKLEIGNVNILKVAMNDMNLNSDEMNTIAELVDKKSLTALGNYLNSLNITEDHKDFLMKLPWLFGEGEVIEEAKKLAFNKEILNSVLYLEELYYMLKKLGYEKFISIDMAMVQRLDYYTGIIFKGYVNGIGSFVLTGGRYDKLTESFGRTMPAIGFSIKVDLLVDYCNYEEENDSLEIVVEEENIIDSIKKAIDLTKSGKSINFKYTK
jgi:ATP phosphoribosyltransferase regulatory subunit